MWYSQSGPIDLRWFGDGRGLGFSAHNESHVAAVFRLRLDTGVWDTIPLSTGEFWTAIEWNRDGSAFYFGRRDANAGIYERAVNGGADRLVYRATPFSQPRPLEFSPDRKWLAFQLRNIEEANSGNAQILILDVGTGESRVVFEHRFSTTEPWRFDLMGWTPSSDLLVRRRSDAASEFQVVPLKGGAPRSIALATFGANVPGEKRPEVFAAKWSPDGRTVVLGRSVRGLETFVIENPLAAVTGNGVKN